MGSFKTIRIKCDGHLYKEAKAGAVITPGTLLSRDANGAFIPHATAGGAFVPLFAFEGELTGRTIQDTYASGEQCHALSCFAGHEVHALLVAGGSVSPGDALSSNGDGTLKAAGAGDTVVGYAMESLDISGGGDPHIWIELAA